MKDIFAGPGRLGGGTNTSMIFGAIVIEEGLTDMALVVTPPDTETCFLHLHPAHRDRHR